MTLQEALTIGSKAEGSIKATYAVLYNEKGEKLFSLQITNAQYNISDLIEENGKVLAGDIAIIRTADPKVLLFRDVKSTAKNGIGDVEDVNELDMTPYRLPVVKASVYNLNRSKMNPVTLTPEAREIILEKIMPKAHYYKLCVKYDVYDASLLNTTPTRHVEDLVVYEGYMPYDLTKFYDGSPGKMYSKFKGQDWYEKSISHIVYYYFHDLWNKKSWRSGLLENGGAGAYAELLKDDFRYAKLLTLVKQGKISEIYTNIELYDKSDDRVAAPYAKLAEIIKDNGTLYAKPVAFDWGAIDLKNATVETEDGTEINLNDAIQAAQEELQQAKNMLYLAGASSLF